MNSKSSQKNWVRGFDRIAILLTVPVFLFCGDYGSKAAAEYRVFSTAKVVKDEKGMISLEEFDGTPIYSIEVPRRSKDYLIGLLGGVGGALCFVFGVGLTTRGVPRVCRWVKNGFSNH